MNRGDFNRFITGDALPSGVDIDGIRELTTLFPWFHSAHLVLLRGLKESSDIKFDSQLHNSALYIADREVLYHFLFPSTTVVKEKVVVAEEQLPDKELPARNEENEVPHAEAVVQEEVKESEDTSLKSREELIAEIESRLSELYGSVARESISDAKQVPDNIAQEASLPGADEVPAEETMEYASSEEESAPSFIAADTSVNNNTHHNHTVDETVLELEPVIDQPVESFTITENTDTGEADDELLELITNDEPEEKEQKEEISPSDLIERFILTNPRLERMSITETVQPVDLSDDSVQEKGSFITETLARIYLNQGYYSKAINIYEKLTLKYPEKSAYFASRIEKVKELIK